MSSGNLAYSFPVLNPLNMVGSSALSLKVYVLWNLVGDLLHAVFSVVCVPLLNRLVGAGDGDLLRCLHGINDPGLGSHGTRQFLSKLLLLTLALGKMAALTAIFDPEPSDEEDAGLLFL